MSIRIMGSLVVGAFDWRTEFSELDFIAGWGFVSVMVEDFESSWPADPYPYGSVLVENFEGLWPPDLSGFVVIFTEDFEGSW